VPDELCGTGPTKAARATSAQDRDRGGTVAPGAVRVGVPLASGRVEADEPESDDDRRKEKEQRAVRDGLRPDERTDRRLRGGACDRVQLVAEDGVEILERPVAPERHGSPAVGYRPGRGVVGPDGTLEAADRQAVGAQGAAPAAALPVEGPQDVVVEAVRDHAGGPPPDGDRRVLEVDTDRRDGQQIATAPERVGHGGPGPPSSSGAAAASDHRRAATQVALPFRWAVTVTVLASGCGDSPSTHASPVTSSVQTGQTWTGCELAAAETPRARPAEQITRTARARRWRARIAGGTGHTGICFGPDRSGFYRRVASGSERPTSRVP
jgi:hypothetical protein